MIPKTSIEVSVQSSPNKSIDCSGGLISKRRYVRPKNEIDRFVHDRRLRTERNFLRDLEISPFKCKNTDGWTRKERRSIDHLCFIILPYLFKKFKSRYQKDRVVLLYDHYFHLNLALRLSLRKRSIGQNQAIARYFQKEISYDNWEFLLLSSEFSHVEQLQ